MASLKSLHTAAREASRHLAPDVLEWFFDLELLTAEELVALLDMHAGVKHVSRWRSQGCLIGLPVSQGFVYPAYQVDETRKRLQPAVVEFNRSSRHLGDPWQRLSAWFLASSVAAVGPSSTGGPTA